MFWSYLDARSRHPFYVVWEDKEGQGRGAKSPRTSCTVAVMTVWDSGPHLSWLQGGAGLLGDLDFIKLTTETDHPSKQGLSALLREHEDL